MKRHGNRARLGGVLLAVALGALALLALPSIGLSHDSKGDHGPRAAGKVASFNHETGELTVDLAGGGSISALVVRRTQIRCGKGRHHKRGHHHRGDHGASASRRGGGELGDDRGGQGEDQPGDDRGGQGLEPSDDRGEHGAQGDEQGDDHPGDHGDRGHHGRRCNAGDLVEGAVVMRAEIVLTHGKALYKKIGLLPSQFNENDDEEEEGEEPPSEEGESEA